MTCPGQRNIASLVFLPLLACVSVKPFVCRFATLTLQMESSRFETASSENPGWFPFTRARQGSCTNTSVSAIDSLERNPQHTFSYAAKEPLSDNQTSTVYSRNCSSALAYET